MEEKPKTLEDVMQKLADVEQVLNIQNEVATPEPKRKIAVLRHDDLDGMGAAYAIWKALNATCELLFLKVQYGQDVPFEELKAFAPEKVFIVDFSYPAATLHIIQEMITNDLTVIDHHKTSLAELQKWQPESSINPGAGSYFHDETMAGCTLTWDLFHLDTDWNPEENAGLQPSLPAPEILLYVADRDLWKFELEHSKEINAFIATMDEDFQVWDDFYTPEAYDCGKAILKFQAEQIRRRLRDVRMVKFGYNVASLAPAFDAGQKAETYHPEKLITLVPFVNASENISELGEAMCEAYPESPFSVSYCDRADGKRSYSLRSRNGFDVSGVAKAFGGGGHPGAAGFSLPSPDII